MARESTGSAAIEEHGAEEAGHHEERWHAEDVDPEDQDPRQSRAVGILVDPDLRLAVDDRGVDDHAEQHHRGPHHIESVVPTRSRCSGMKRMHDRWWRRGGSRVFSLVADHFRAASRIGRQAFRPASSTSRSIGIWSISMIGWVNSQGTSSAVRAVI